MDHEVVRLSRSALPGTKCDGERLFRSLLDDALDQLTLHLGKKVLLAGTGTAISPFSRCS